MLASNPMNEERAARVFHIDSVEKEIIITKHLRKTKAFVHTGKRFVVKF